MKQRIYNGHSLEFFDTSNTKQGELLASGSFVAIASGSSRGIVLGQVSGYARISSTNSSLFIGGGSTSEIQIQNNLIPDSDSVRNLGSTDRFFANVYADSITVGVNDTLIGDAGATGNSGLLLSSGQNVFITFDTNGTGADEFRVGHGSGNSALLSIKNATSKFANQLAVKTPTAFTANTLADELVIGSGVGSQGMTIYSGDSNQGAIHFADDLDEEGAGDSPAGNRDGVIQYAHNNSQFNIKTGGNQNALTVKHTTSEFHSALTVPNLTVTGDLSITGDINSYNVTDLDVTDKTITIGKGQTEANSGGSGIIVDGSSASILWDESNDTWDLNKGLDVAGNATFAGTVTAATTFIADAVDATNSDPGTDNVRFSGYGMIGNRGNLYVTNFNSSGTVQIGIGGAHNAAPRLSISSGTVKFFTSLTANSDSAFDIGTNSTRFRDLYVDEIDGGNSKLLTSDANNYFRINTSGGSAQLGLFRTNSGTTGGGYIGIDGANFRIYNESFSPKLTLSTSNGDATFTGDVSLADNKKLKFGAAHDYEIYHNSSTNVNHISSLVDRQLSLNANIINLTNQANSDTVIRVSGSRVGIGTITPNEKLHVEGTSRFSGDMHFGSAVQGLVYKPVEGNSAIDRFFLMFDETNNASFPFLTNRTPNGAVVIKTGTAAGGAENEHFRIEGGDGTVDAYFTNANLGIGTTTPASVLHINTGTGTNNTNTVILDRATIASYSGLSFATTGSVDWSIGQNSANNLEIFEDGQDAQTRLTVLSGGNVGINASNPTHRLTVNSGITNVVAKFKSSDNQAWISIQDNDSGTYGALFGTDSDSGEEIVIANKSATKRFSIDSNGKTKLHAYGSGNRTGTAAYNLQVDSSGNVIETAAGGGGSGTIDGSGTATYIPKFSDSDTLTSSGMFQAAGGNFSIGITTPNAKLSVQDSISIGTSATDVLKLHNESGVGTIDGYSTRNIALGSVTNGEVMRIDNANGRVGIGTTSPGRQMELKGQAVIRLNADSTDPGLDFVHAGTQDMQLRYRVTTNKLAFYSYGTSSDVFTIQQSNGYVGINTTSPDRFLEIFNEQDDDFYGLKIAKLHSNTNQYTAEYANNGISFSDNQNFRLFNGSNTVAAFHNGSVIFYTNGGIERMRIDTNGDIGIGTTSPARQFSVLTSDSNVARFESSTTNSKIEVKDVNTTAYVGASGGFSAFGPFSSTTDTGNIRIASGSEIANSNGYGAFGSTPVSDTKWKITSTIDTSANSSYNAQLIDLNVQGSTAVSADKQYRGLFIDLDSTATGGDTSDEVRLVGNYIHVNDTGDADLIEGVSAVVQNQNSDASSTISNIRGLHSSAAAKNSAGTVNNLIGVSANANMGSVTGGDITNVYGTYSTVSGGNTDKTPSSIFGGFFKVDAPGFESTYGTTRGVYSEIEIDGNATSTNLRAFEGIIDLNSGSHQDLYQLKLDTQINANASQTGINYGIFSSNAKRHFIQGNTLLGSTNAGTPGAVLHIYSTGSGLTGIQIQNSTTTFDSNIANDGLSIGVNGNDAYFFSRESGDMYIAVNDNAANGITIKSGGNVGVGTTSPAGKLHVYNTSTTSDGDGTATQTASGQDSILLYGHGGTNGQTYGSITWMGGTRRRAMISAVAENTDTDFIGLAFYTQGTDGSGDFAESMRISRSGRVGIGTSSPGGELHIVGQTGGAGQLYISDRDNGTGTGDALLLTKSGTSAYLYNRDSGDLGFGSNDSNTMVTIKSTGRVGISTTNPQATLSIGDNIGTFNGISIGASANRDIRIGQGSSNNLVIGWKYNATATSAYSVIENYGGNNPLILQGSGGKVGIGNTGPNFTLDVRGTGNEVIFVSGSSARLQVKGGGTHNNNLNIYSWTSAVNIFNNSSTTPEVYFGRDASADNIFYFRDNSGFDLMKIDTAENRVGIGTTSMDTKLHISSSAFNDHITLARGTNKLGITVSGTQLLFEGGVSPFSNINEDLGRSDKHWNEIFVYSVRSGGVLQFKSNGNNERMRIDADGNVGIGTSTLISNGRLHVKTSTDTGVSHGLVIERSNAADKGYINYQGGAFRMVATDGDPLKFGHASNNNRLEIQSDGTVLISGDLQVNGTTTTVNSTNLDLSDNIIGLNRGASSNVNDSGIIIERGSTGDNAAFLWDESDDVFVLGLTTSTPSATGNIALSDFRGLKTGPLTASGNITTTSNSHLVLSRKFAARDANGVMLTADDGLSGLSIADNGEASFSTNVSTAGQLSVGDSNADILQVGLKSVVTYGENTDIDTTTGDIKSLPIATYQAAFFDYVIKKGTNIRSGTVTAAHDGTNITFNEVSTIDLGDTTDVTLQVVKSGSNMVFQAVTLSNDWSVKAFVRAIKV